MNNNIYRTALLVGFIAITGLSTPAEKVVQPCQPPISLRAALYEKFPGWHVVTLRDLKTADKELMDKITRRRVPGN